MDCHHLNQHMLHFKVHGSHPGILLKCQFGFCRAEGRSKILHFQKATRRHRAAGPWTTRREPRAWSSRPTFRDYSFSQESGKLWTSAQKAAIIYVHFLDAQAMIPSSLKSHTLTLAKQMDLTCFSKFLIKQNSGCYFGYSFPPSQNTGSLELPSGSADYGPGMVATVALLTAVEQVGSLTQQLPHAVGAAKK